VEGQSDVHALDLILAVEVHRVGDHPPAAVASVGVPDVVLMTEDVLASELFHMLDLEVVSGLGTQIILDLPPFVHWRLHNDKACQQRVSRRSPRNRPAAPHPRGRQGQMIRDQRRFGWWHEDAVDHPTRSRHASTERAQCGTETRSGHPRCGEDAQVRMGAPPGTRTPDPLIKSQLERVLDSVNLLLTLSDSAGLCMSGAHPDAALCRMLPLYCAAYEHTPSTRDTPALKIITVGGPVSRVAGCT